MKQCFGDRMKDGTFRREKRYLFITLISFSISYLIDVTRNATIYAMMRLNSFSDTDQDQTKVQTFFCESNFMMSIFNVSTFLIVELTPYLIIFSLNFANFRKIGLQD